MAKTPFVRAGKNLSRLRHERGWTQEAAAEKIGISLKYYQALEAGTKAPAFPMLCVVRRVFAAEWNDLLKGH